jgi:hypothetical protein
MKVFRKDMSLLADIFTIALFLIALIAWIATWPSTLVPRALSFVGFGVWLALRVADAALTVHLSPREWRILALLTRVVTVVLLVALLWPVVWFWRVLGGVVLLCVFSWLVVRLALWARHRYLVIDAGG